VNAKQLPAGVTSGTRYGTLRRLQRRKDANVPASAQKARGAKKSCVSIKEIEGGKGPKKRKIWGHHGSESN